MKSIKSYFVAAGLVGMMFLLNMFSFVYPTNAQAKLEKGQWKTTVVRGIHFAHIAQPEGRIYFAGEHTSKMFGALESGKRAASEIYLRLGK